MKLRKTKVDVEFCDRCSRVCDSRCRAEKVRQKNVERGIRHGWGLR